MKVLRTTWWRGTALLVLVTLLLPGAASAQRFKWWQSERVQRELGLTREQSTRLEEVFQSYLPKLRQQKATLDAAEERFNTLVAKGDHAATLAQVDVVESARAALSKTRALQLVYMRRVLTTDQHAKLTALLAASRDRDRGNPAERRSR